MSFVKYWKKHPFELPHLEKAEGIKSWITVHGSHIPIMEGQSKEEAVKEHIDGGRRTEYQSMSDSRFSNVASLAAKVPHIHPDDVAVMVDFIEASESKEGEAQEKLAGSLGTSGEDLAEHWGISQDKGIKHIAQEFKRIFAGHKKVRATNLGSMKKASI